MNFQLINERQPTKNKLLDILVKFILQLVKRKFVNFK